MDQRKLSPTLASPPTSHQLTRRQVTTCRLFAERHYLLRLPGARLTRREQHQGVPETSDDGADEAMPPQLVARRRSARPGMGPSHAAGDAVHLSHDGVGLSFCQQLDRAASFEIAVPGVQPNLDPSSVQASLSSSTRYFRSSRRCALTPLGVLEPAAQPCTVRKLAPTALTISCWLSPASATFRTTLG